MKGVSKVFEGRKYQQQKFRLKDLDPDSEFEITPKISLHFFSLYSSLQEEKYSVNVFFFSSLQEHKYYLLYSSLQEEKYSLNIDDALDTMAGTM